MLLFVCYTLCIVPASLFVGYLSRDFVTVTFHRPSERTNEKHAKRNHAVK